ncbi:MAG: DUF2273 domain-containing protein [Atopobiaceae bacterium]|nr:DUF2273 domain-containing protein [Atopobiaceae bacterium]
MTKSKVPVTLEGTPDATNQQSTQAKDGAPKTKNGTSVFIDSSEPARDGAGAGSGKSVATGESTGSASGPYAWISKVAPGHEHAVLGGICGLVFAVLFFVIGFWQTLFVALLVVVGVAFGQYLDGDPRIVNLIRRALTGGMGDD